MKLYEPTRTKLSSAMLAGCRKTGPARDAYFIPAHETCDSTPKACAMGAGLVGLDVINLDTGALKGLLSNPDPGMGDFGVQLAACNALWPGLAESNPVFNAWLIERGACFSPYESEWKSLHSAILHANDMLAVPIEETAAKLAELGL